MSVRCIPNAGRILVKPDPPPDVIAGILRPDTSYERSQSGIVVALPETGMEDEFFNVGERVLFSPLAGHEFVVQGETLFLMEPNEVMGWMSATR